MTLTLDIRDKRDSRNDLLYFAGISSGKEKKRENEDEKRSRERETGAGYKISPPLLFNFFLSFAPDSVLAGYFAPDRGAGVSLEEARNDGFENVKFYIIASFKCIYHEIMPIVLDFQ